VPSDAPSNDSDKIALDIIIDSSCKTLSAILQPGSSTTSDCAMIIVAKVKVLKISFDAWRERKKTYYRGRI
jgi:hypothetical protein